MPSFDLTTDGETDLVLLASGFGDEDSGGGLFAYDGGEVEQIDHVATVGLGLGDGVLLRVLESTGEVGTLGELLVYDERGVLRYYRVDAMEEPHDVAWNGASFILVATLANKILWMGPDGQLERVWHPEGTVGDCWHLNNLLFHEGRTYICAFGRFPRHRDWARAGAKEGAGILFDIDTGEDIVTGLSAPHTPRVIDEHWVVCNSGTQEVLRYDFTTRQLVDRLQLVGWTRGVAVSDRYVFVGESGTRRETVGKQNASIAVIRRDTWELEDRIELASREIYDLILAPSAMLPGLRTGFRTNPVRVREDDQFEMFRRAGVQPVRLWATGDPLPEEACRVHVAVDVHPVQPAMAMGDVECVVKNLAGAILVSAQPNPVNVSYRWFDTTSGAAVEEGVRTPLPRSLPPGEELTFDIKLVTPQEPGEYEVRVTLVQEGVRWFDDVTPENGCTVAVTVTA